MIRKQLICYLLMTLLVVPIAWSKERAIRPADQQSNADIRQALVIGNSAYTSAGMLRNPVNDARAISNTLSQLGFEATTITNADQRKMEQSIRDFGKELRNQKGVGLFYYAGHGMQFDGENYLLPTDIDPSTEEDVRYDAVPVGKLLAQMRAADNKMNVVILDACRNNPFSRSFRTFNPGLAQVNAAAGTFISFATAPGQIAADGEGSNGLFTSKLLQHLRTPNLKIEEVFKRTTADVYRASNKRQAPWVQYSVIGDFFFVPKGKSPQVPNQTALNDLQKRSDAEQAARLEQQRLEAQWKEWQEKMKLAYKNTSRTEENSKNFQLKIEAWQSFLKIWEIDNQYSQQDEDLRAKARIQIDQLLAESENKIESQTKEKVIKEKVKSDLTDVQKAKSQREWTDWQISMQKDFDEKLRFEKRPILNYLKKNSWDSFLEKWAANNPFSKEDESLRQRANLKVNSYSTENNTASTGVSQWEKLLPNSDSSFVKPTKNLLDLKNELKYSSNTPQNLSGATAKKKLLETKICVGCDISGANLRDIKLRRADLSSANLRGADLTGADLIGADLTGVNLVEAALNEADLREINLRGANLSSVNLKYANLRRADLRGADLRGADLRGADLTRADLRRVDLRGANLSANLQRVHLTGANLTGANLIGVNLSSVNLNDANLRRANLSSVNLNGAYLEKADLSSANLRGANLSSANLRGADLTGVNLEYTNLSRAKFCNTTMTDGSINNSDC